MSNQDEKKKTDLSPQESELKSREVITENTVKMIYGGITRIVPKNKVNEFKKKGYVEMS